MNSATPTQRIKPALASLALLFAIFLAGCQADASNGDAEDGEAKAEEVPAIPVEATQVALGDVAAAYEGTASLEADEHAMVVAKVSGVALRVEVEEGDYVKQGTVLARLEQDRYQLELQRAAAELNRLKNEFKRNEEMFKRELVSTDAYDRVRFELESQTAAHALAQLNLDYTTIRAPIDGYVSERLVKVGNLVTEHQSVFRIDSFDPLLAVLHVPEREIGIISKGQQVQIRLDAYPGQAFAGTVTRIAPVVDPDTGTFRVTAEVDDPSELLKPGLFGRVRVVYENRNQVPVVSREAIISEDGSNHVFVIGEDNKVVRQAVNLGFSNDQVVQILEGLDLEQQVVTAGKGTLRDGSLVEVISLPPQEG